MTSVVFENATFQDVILKAAKVAPSRGAAFDKAAGIMVEIDAQENEVVVRSTNLEIFYTEVCDAVSIEGESVKWILPGQVIEAFASKLPIGSGKTVKFEQEGNLLNVSTGRTRAKIRLISNQYYPDWQPFNPSELSSISKFGDLVNIVSWAADRGGLPPLNGISIDGEYIAATDRFRVARMPMKIDILSEPITIPLTITKLLSKQLSDVEIGVDDTFLLIMPDESTQIMATRFAEPHPKLDKLFHATEPNVVKFNKQALVEIIDRAMVMSGRDRMPALRMYLVKETLAVFMVDEHSGQLGDMIEVPGYAKHSRHQIIFSPKILLDSLNHSPNDQIELWYDTSNPHRPVRLDGGSGYEVVIVPRRDLTPIKDASNE